MKEAIYNSVTGTTGLLSIEDVILNFAAAAIISIFIYLSYRISHTGVVYSKKFNVSLVMLVLVTTLVMNVIGNNIALSLGMVGALSIVRFRTAIKDARDTVYIFWAIAVGICCGVSDYLTAAIGTFIIFLFLVFFGLVKNNERIMLILHICPEGLEEVEKQIDVLMNRKARLKVFNQSCELQQTELIYEISESLLHKCEKKNGSCVRMLTEMPTVKSISLIRQNEDVNQ